MYIFAGMHVLHHDHLQASNSREQFRNFASLRLERDTISEFINNSGSYDLVSSFSTRRRVAIHFVYVICTRKSREIQDCYCTRGRHLVRDCLSDNSYCLLLRQTGLYMMELGRSLAVGDTISTKFHLEHPACRAYRACNWYNVDSTEKHTFNWKFSFENLTFQIENEIQATAIVQASITVLSGVIISMGEIGFLKDSIFFQTLPPFLNTGYTFTEYSSTLVIRRWHYEIQYLHARYLDSVFFP